MTVRSSQQPVGNNGHSAASAQPLTFVLHSAESYFNVSQPKLQPDKSDTTKLKSPNLAKLDQKPGTPDVTEPQDVKVQQQQFKELGLTGNIISATAHLPWRIGLTKDGKIELAPRRGKSMLRESLSYLSDSSTWHHTVVGWTGEVLSAFGPEFTELLEEKNVLRSQASSNDGRQMGNVTIHDPDGSGFKDAFSQYFKEQDSFKRDMIITKDHRRELETLLQHVFKNTIVPVWLGEWSEDQDNTLVLNNQARWEKYAEEELHKKLDRVMVEKRSPSDRAQLYADYRRLNEAVAYAILKVYMPGDIIWVSDYQLMLLPAILRKKLPSAYIAYFHYASWCPREMLAELPEHDEILKGLLGASVIGLPSGGLRHYLEDYYRDEMGLASIGDGLVDTGNSLVNLINVPTVLDVKAVHKAAYEDTEVDRHMSSIRNAYQEKKIIVARARLDRPGGISFLLEGFESLLDHEPELQQRAVLFLITTPDREVTEGDKAIVDQEVASQLLRINSKWSSITHQSIVYLARPLPSAERYALLRLADAGWVTSDHEDINTLSMEFVVSQQEKCSPLLVSDRSSKARTPSAPQNPQSNTSSDDPTASMRDSIWMSDDEKRRRHKALWEYFSKHDVTSFTEEFLTRARVSFAKYSSSRDAPALDMDALGRRYREARRRLFMFDYDGTLTPIVDDPDHALPTELLLSSLPKLANTPENAVWIISGRSRVFLEQHFGHLSNIGLSAEHGSFVRKPASTEWQNLAASMDMGWKKEVDKVFRSLEAEAPGSWIERKEVAMVWHYRNAADHDSCLTKAVSAKALLEGERVKSWDVEVMLGKANLEVRPRFLNKGVVATNLLKEAFGKERDGFVLCAGDDTTDEGKHWSDPG